MMMSVSANWPIPIMTIGAANAGTVLFRKGGKLNVTCVLKSTLRLVPDEPMKIVEADELFVAEMHYRDNPTRSIRATSDIVPYLPRVDVVLTGHAHAPSGRPTKQLEVRLAVYHSIALLEKKLLVVGDRKGADIVPFERMPLIYEKALGGLGDPLNPWGTGQDPKSSPPNIVPPKDVQAVAGFGPISRALRPRKMLRGNVSLAQLDESVIELPADFDWNYFQAAPPDQQLASLVGNEWIVIEGMHPKLPRIASRLPTVHPIAAVFGLDPAKPEATQMVQARVDMLRIDADKLTCSVVSRAVVPIDDERTVATIRVVAAVETEDLKYAHLLTPPSLTGAQMGMTARVGPVAKKKADDGGTVVLGDAPAPNKAIPFAPQRKFEIEDEATVDMDIASHHEEGKKPATPFPAPGPKRASASRRAPIPGAPWSPESARAAKPPRTRSGTMVNETVALAPAEEPTRKFVKPDLAGIVESQKPPVIPPAPVPVPPPLPKKEAVVVHTTPEARPEHPPTPKSEPPPKDFWGKTGTELPIATGKPSPPKIPAKPAVNKAIYGGFGPVKKKT